MKNKKGGITYFLSKVNPMKKEEAMRKAKELVVCFSLILAGTIFLAQKISPQSSFDWLSSDSSLRLQEAVSSEANSRSKIMNIYDSLPVYFIENKGQQNDHVKFSARIRNGDIFFLEEGLVYQFIQRMAPKRSLEKRRVQEKGKLEEKFTVETVKVTFIGAQRALKVQGENESEARFNYFRGNDSKKWVQQAKTYDQVCYKNIYPGIDLFVSGRGGVTKNEFRLSPGAEASAIRLRYEGIQGLRVNEKGQIEIKIASGILIEDRPLSYQMAEDEKIFVNARFRIEKDQTVRFEVGDYNKDRELIIDPLIYSAFLGGSQQDFGYGISIDSSGNAYVTGWTSSNPFPTTSGAYDRSYGGNFDAFVTKINSSGTKLLFSTYLGGTDKDYGLGVAVDDKTRNVFITGVTSSKDFPVTAYAYDKTYNGGEFDAFVVCLNSTGASLGYSTYLGGESKEYETSIFLDADRNAYVAGWTESPNFPTTYGAYDRSYNGFADVFVTKINSSGKNLFYSTYVGGTSDDFPWDLAIDRYGNAHVTGFTFSNNFPTTASAWDRTYNGYEDAFVFKLGSTGATLKFSTYLGGSGEDYGSGVAIDDSGNVYVTGSTSSIDFPTTSKAYDRSHNGGTYDVFLSKISSSGGSLIFSTYLGGSGADWSFGIALDSNKNSYLAGYTHSSNFPTTPGAYDRTFNSVDSKSDAFISEFSSTGASLLYSTYLGGSDSDGVRELALSASGYIYVTGETFSKNFPSTSGAFSRIYHLEGDTFITKISK
jgi:hypothetical protein